MVQDKVFPWFASCYEILTKAYNSQRLPHGLLVNAVSGSGKMSFAQSLAKDILCERSKTCLQSACGSCKSCLLFKANSHPDFYLVERLLDNKGKQKQSIGIDQIRMLNSKLVDTPQLSGWRVALIESVEAMTVASFNALLKTLEEPGRNTLLLLLACNLHQIPATIKSRCQVVQPDLTGEQVKKWLLENSSGVESSVEFAIDSCFNAPLKAKQYLESDAAQAEQQLYQLFDQLLLNLATPQSVLEAFKLEEADIWRILATYFYRVEQARLTGAGLAEYSQLSPRLAFDLYQKTIDYNKAKFSGSNLQSKLQLQSILIQWFESGRKMLYYSKR